MKILTNLIALILCTSLSANILVVEYKSEKDTFEHGHHVEHIACEDLEARECESVYTITYLDTFLDHLYLKMHNKNIVNMSFGYYEPNSLLFPGGKASFQSEEKIKKGIDEFYEQNENFKNIFAYNTDKLFTIAAGNGHPKAGPEGVPLGEMFPSYPNMYNAPNVMKVAAIDEIGTFELAPYSNFSLWHVDIAAFVETGVDGKKIKGTSFSAPSVAKMAAKISRKYPLLNGIQLKEIFMKSAFIKNIPAAISITMDHLVSGDESLASKIHGTFHMGKRADHRAKKGEVILVKSGGIANLDVAMKCADLFSEQGKDLSIQASCLKAQKQLYSRSEEDLRDLVYLWSIRRI